MGKMSVYLPQRILLDFPSVTSYDSLPFLWLWHRPKMWWNKFVVSSFIISEVNDEFIPGFPYGISTTSRRVANWEAGASRHHVVQLKTLLWNHSNITEIWYRVVEEGALNYSLYALQTAVRHNIFRWKFESFHHGWNEKHVCWLLLWLTWITYLITFDLNLFVNLILCAR